MEHQELTDLPAFNQLADEVEALLAGADPEPARQSWQTVDAQLGDLFARFVEEMSYREETPVVAEQGALAEESFLRLREALARLGQGLESQDATQCRTAVEECRRHLHLLFGAFARLRQEEEARPRLSPLPVVDELLRVAGAYGRGRLPRVRLQERLRLAADFHLRLRLGLEGLEPLPAERRVLEERRPQLQAALEEMGQGLKEAEGALEEGDEELLAEALEAVRRAAVHLAQVQEALQTAVEVGPTRPCLRCGAANPVAARYCAACNALLPQVELEVEEEPRLDLVDSGAPGERALPENLQRLVEAVEGVRTGRTGPADFLATLDWLEALVASASRRLRGLEEPPRETPEEQMSLYRQARRTMEEGLALMDEGLRTLRSYLDTEQPQRLDRGLEQVLEGGDRVLAFQTHWQTLLSLAGQAEAG